MELNTTNGDITIIAPCFNEKATVLAFLSDLQEVLTPVSARFRVIIVDDSSTDNTLEMLKKYEVGSQNVSLEILALKFNVGHQGAIFQGLLYAAKSDCNKFIIMDSDGEDDPRAIPELIKINNYDIVHVARGRRKESLLFRVSYYSYRLIFKFITGKVLNFGNYCMINKKTLENACYTSFIHFAAHLSKQKASSKSIVYNRRKRLDGRSKMNLTSLIHHAFKSFVEYAEELLMMFLKLFVIIGIAFAVLMAIVIYKKFFTDEAVLGWASTMSLGLFDMALICLGFFVIGILLLNVMARNTNSKKGISERVE